MQISDVDVCRRKELLEFTDSDVAYLVSCFELVERNVDDLVSALCAQQTSLDDIARLIRDADTRRRLCVAQRHYILRLFAGSYDIHYVYDRLRIGMVLKHAGVAPKVYLAAAASIKNLLCNFLDKSISDKRRLKCVLRALDKLLCFDNTLVVDTYICSLLIEVEMAKDRMTLYARDLELRMAERTRQLEELSRHDVLTDVFNRRALLEFLERELLQARRHARPLSFAYFDIDNLKEINDTRGHVAGDEVLQAMGRLLLERSRQIDLPCRYGGDEFCLVMPDCTIAGAESVVRRLIADFFTHVPGVTFSTGLVQTGPTAFLEITELIRIADEKMYKSKLQPGFQVTV